MSVSAYGPSINFYDAAGKRDRHRQYNAGGIARRERNGHRREAPAVIDRDCSIRLESCSGERRSSDLPCQMAVLDPMGLIGGSAEASAAIGFVIRIVPFEPDDAAVAFERENVSGDAIQKPAVVS